MDKSLWVQKDNTIVKEYQFSTFIEAIEFIKKVAIIAEDIHHHPMIQNIYTKVILSLSTHEAGDRVTDKDWALAYAIDKII